MNVLKEIAEKTGLQISFPKTGMMTTNKHYTKKVVKTKYGQIRVTKWFKHLGEIISNNGTDKLALENKRLKLEKLSFATKDIYNKKNLSINANKALQRGGETGDFIWCRNGKSDELGETPED